MTTIAVPGAGIGGPIRRGQIEPFYEKLLMKWIGAGKLKGAQ